MDRRHGGKGAGRSPSTRRRIFRNSALGTATSAGWNVAYPAWLTTLAPIFTSLSRSVVSDQCSTSFGNARVSGWLESRLTGGAIGAEPRSNHLGSALCRAGHRPKGGHFKIAQMRSCAQAEGGVEER